MTFWDCFVLLLISVPLRSERETLEELNRQLMGRGAGDASRVRA